MAVLSAEQREGVRGGFSAEMSVVREGVDATKPELAAAVAAIDDWIEANRAAFNAAIPEPARSGLTAKQKVKLHLAIMRRRWELS